jgi:hypothetical protein
VSFGEGILAKSGRKPNALFLIFIIIILASLSGCGGGGAGENSLSSWSIPSEPLPPKILSWQPPTRFLDNTPLDPSKDLANFEIYVKGSGGFTETDSPMALVSAVDSGSGRVATTFDLANLGAFLSRGVTYEVALRAVAITGAKSAFSSPATFSF